MSPARPESEGNAFDARRYWRERLAARPDVRGTGTAGLPLAWQRWLYRGKERAYLALLREAGVRLDHARVIDFGCGTGFFEDVWERQGATVAGIDIVPEVVASLASRYPARRYLCADLSAPCDLSALGQAGLVTAIDVLYHIVDDALLAPTLRRLASLVAPGGHLLLTDALADRRPAAHVRFRTLEHWRVTLAEEGLELVARRPVFVAANRGLRAAARLPRVVGAVQYHVDAILLRVTPWLANNWAILARRAA